MMNEQDPVLTLRVRRSTAIAALTLMRKMPLEQVEQPYQDAMQALTDAEMRHAAEQRDQAWQAVEKERRAAEAKAKEAPSVPTVPLS